MIPLACAYPLVVGSIDPSHALPLVVCDHQVRRGHIDEHCRLHGVETGVLFGTGCVEY